MHLALLVTAAVPAVIGVRVIWLGLFHRSYDNTIWSYLGLGGVLLFVTGTFVAMILSDARRRGAR